MRELTKDENALIFLDSFEEIEYKRKYEVLSLVESPKDIFKSQKADEYFSKTPQKELWFKIKKRINDKEYILGRIEKALKCSTDVLTLFSSGYPIELKNTPCPPIALYLNGNRDLLYKDKVAVVGSRKTLPLYLEKGEEISKSLSESGTVIITGIADGGDSSAISGSIDSGNLICVLPSGLNNVMPRSKHNLVKQVENSGLVISEYPADVSVKKYTYPARNRIIAGLSKGVLIISGDQKSGASYTSSYANDYGREVLCLPYGLGVQSGELPVKLIKSGAFLVESASEIASLLKLNVPKSKKIKLSDNEERVLLAVKDGVSSVDELTEKLDLKSYEIIALLGSLELKKAIVKTVFGNYESLI